MKLTLIGKKQIGITMIEILITIAIMAIILSLAAPSFQDSVNRHKLDQAVDKVFNDLNYVRSEAMKQNQNVTFQLGATDNSSTTTTWCYGLDDNSDNNAGTSCDCSDYYPTNADTADDYCKIDSVDKTNSVTLHPDVTLSSSISAYDAITYNRFGKRTNIGTANVFTLSISGISSTVTINEVGRITRQ